ncbi:unnamed protein product [Dovyalis caffra]|uniref:TF-B3 domain-containing protein n=1 Tax=Dovyalis caffra TaxID=77055 RepID=A0AAV1R755_9ROSI|nr:unnamed protein product [Dovyalis caffra]
MAKSKQTYEEIRQKRMEENKKRMEELNLTKLSQSLLSKPSPMKKGKPRISRPAVASTPVRRSTRVADRPTVSYKEVPMEPLERPRRSYSYRRRGLLYGVYVSNEAREHAIDKAEEIQSLLGADFPSFIKPMVQSHVSGCFWLGLPVHFCKSHLPLNDEMMTLQDEKGDKFQAKYLAQKTGLSGGWRGFAIDHELFDGDALLFQLVEPTKFKVYIARADSEDRENKEDMEEDNEEKENIDKDENSDSTHMDGRARRTRASNCFSTLLKRQKLPTQQQRLENYESTPE